MDTFFAALPVSQDGYSMAPFFAYTAIGKSVRIDSLTEGRTGYRSGFVTPNGQLDLNEDNANAYWAGTNFELTQMDPIGVKASFIYGALNTDEDENERAGWYADLSMNYEMENMTPEIFGFYSSGEDDDADDGSEVMPYIYNDGLTSKAPSMMIGDMTTLGITSPDTTARLQSNPVGLWSVGASLNHIQLMDRLTGTLTAAYYQGTNDEDAANESAPLSEEDSAWDVTASTHYELYENLSAICEAGYAKVDLDSGDADEPAYRLATGLQYSF